jgi:AICAR transformylase/IMP cyclohydrolase PurH
MTKDEKQWVLEENKRQLLLCELKLGKVLINKTNGIVYLKGEEQIKIGMGKSRKGYCDGISCI